MFITNTEFDRLILSLPAPEFKTFLYLRYRIRLEESKQYTSTTSGVARDVGISVQKMGDIIRRLILDGYIDVVNPTETQKVFELMEE